MVFPIAFIAQKHVYIQERPEAVIHKLIAYHISEGTNSIAVNLWPVSAALFEA